MAHMYAAVSVPNVLEDLFRAVPQHRRRQRQTLRHDIPMCRHRKHIRLVCTRNSIVRNHAQKDPPNVGERPHAARSHRRRQEPLGCPLPRQPRCECEAISALKTHNIGIKQSQIAIEQSQISTEKSQLSTEKSRIARDKSLSRTGRGSIPP